MERPLLISHCICPESFKLPILLNGLRSQMLKRNQAMAQALYSVYSLDLVAAAKENLWRQWGIFDTIMLTKNETTLNPGLLYGLIGFWNTFINVFVFLFRMISPTQCFKLQLWLRLQLLWLRVLRLLRCGLRRDFFFFGAQNVKIKEIQQL